MTSVDTFFKNLKAHREKQGINLDEISERTKINERYFESIENGRFNVLPTVYMRLFLRSYCIEIGADPEQALKDFEVYTTGKVSQTPDLKFKPVEEELKVTNIKNEPVNFGSSISRKNIFYFIIGIIIIFSLVKFVSFLTREAEGSVKSSEMNSGSVNTGNGLSGLDGDYEGEQSLTPLPLPSQLTESAVYDSHKLVRQEAFQINTQPPFRMTLSARTRTKVHISSGDNNLFNGIMDVNDNRTFTASDTLKFDFWSAQHVQANINGVDLTPFLGRTDRAIRGSLITDGSLSVQFFSH